MEDAIERDRGEVADATDRVGGKGGVRRGAGHSQQEGSIPPKNERTQSGGLIVAPRGADFGVVCGAQGMEY